MKIATALDKIEEHQLYVPAFQREYVWKRDDAKQLIDSLIKEYPTGTMLTWETDRPPELKGEHKYNRKQGAVKILLDGQQRLTTLFMLIRGEIPPYYSAAEITNDTRNLFVNLETLELSYYSKARMENAPLWQNITHIFQRDISSRDVEDQLKAKGDSVSRDRYNRIDDSVKAIERVLDRDFPEQTIPVKATVTEAIDIFYKVNASGVALTDAELALAQISGYWPQARDTFKRKLEELSDKGFVFKLDFLIYVLLGCLYHLGSDMKKLHDPSNGENIREAWEKLNQSTLDYVVGVLRSHAYVDHTSEINSVYALVPIIVYCFEKTPLSDDEIRKIVKWFYYSQIRTRYTSQLPQKLDRDLRIIKEAVNPFDELLRVIEEERSLKIIPEEFAGRSISHPLFGLMRWHFKSKGAQCFTTGIALRQSMGKKYVLENDHIFPYSKLKASGYRMGNRLKYSLAQELTNRAILTQVADRTRGATDAESYLAEVADRYPDALSRQSIPEDKNLWRIENYEEFLEKRRQMLAKELNAFLEGITETAPSQAKVSLEDLIAEGETQELEFKASLRWDIVQGTINKKLEDVVVKTVAAFTNAQGGTLLIGVEDDGSVFGLEADLLALNGADLDKFEIHLRNILNAQFGTAFVTNYVVISFPEIDEKIICQLDIRVSTDPVIVKLKDRNGQLQEKCYVRSGNTSQDLSLSEMQQYFADRVG